MRGIVVACALVGASACGSDDAEASAAPWTIPGGDSGANDSDATSDTGSATTGTVDDDSGDTWTDDATTDGGAMSTSMTDDSGDGETTDGGDSSGGAEYEPPPCPDPQMVHFPVEAPHNIGYDNASCGTGTCEVSCPDGHANSDWNGPAGHHGIDIFAHYQAELVAVADAQVVAVGVVSDTSGIRVRIRDACGWEYYYGHLDEALVQVGDTLAPGDVLGTMGATGTQSVHLHFNVSFDGQYSDDIDPFALLDTTSPTACM